MIRDAPSGSCQTNSEGTSGTVLASLTPMSRNFTPWAASGPTSPREWPGTSVIFAPIVVRPKRWSSDCENPKAPSIMERSMNSVSQVKGSACQARSPAATACSARRRTSLEACSRYSYRSHDPVVQTYRSAPAWRMAAATWMARGKYSSKYSRMIAAWVSANPTSRWHLNITSTRLTSDASVAAGNPRKKSGRQASAPLVVNRPFTKSRLLMSSHSVKRDESWGGYLPPPRAATAIISPPDSQNRRGTTLEQGSVKVRRATEKTPHPPPCGPPSPQRRGIEIKITALSRRERGDRKAVGEGSLRGYYIYSSGGMLHAGL